MPASAGFLKNIKELTMAELCNQCRREDLSVWDTHRVATQTPNFLGIPVKVVHYYCNECLGHGENFYTNNFKKE